MQSIHINDPFQAACLLATGNKLTKCAVSSEHSVMFEISGEEVEEAQTKFEQGQALIEPLTFQKQWSFVTRLFLGILEQIAQEPEGEAHADI